MKIIKRVTSFISCIMIILGSYVVDANISTNSIDATGKEVISHYKIIQTIKSRFALIITICQM